MKPASASKKPKRRVGGGVGRVRLSKAGGAKNRHTGSNEVQRAKTPDDFEKDAQRTPQLPASRLGPLEKFSLTGVATALAPRFHGVKGLALLAFSIPQRRVTTTVS
ncbi:MAG: hypothetical protein ACKVPX_06120 [Myxococcaceae bacterium]